MNTISKKNTLIHRDADADVRVGEFYISYDTRAVILVQPKAGLAIGVGFVLIPREIEMVSVEAVDVGIAHWQNIATFSDGSRAVFDVGGMAAVFKAAIEYPEKPSLTRQAEGEQ